MALGNTDMQSVEKIKQIITESDPVLKAETQAEEGVKEKPVAEPEAVEESDTSDDGADTGDTQDSEVEIDPDEDAGRDEEPVKAIPAPSGLTADEKALFATLPPAAQEAWVRRERDRTKELHRLQSEKDKLSKAMDAERQALSAERAQLSQSIAQYGNGLIKEFQSKFADVTDPLALARTDPVRATEYKAYIDQINLMNMELMRAQDAEKIEAQQKQVAFREEHNQLIREKLNLDSDDAFNKWDSEITEYASKQGIPPDRLARADAVSLHALHKAMLWDRAVARKQQLEKGKTPPPAFVKAGAKSDMSSKEERYTANRNRLKKTHSIDDAARVIKGML